MSDEEDETCSSPEEGFSASEDEWKPGKEMRGGESSDDDDSDFESSPPVGGGVGGGTGAALTTASAKRRDPKARSASKQQAIKKRKASSQSLRSKLYNKYKPPPKTFPVRADSNSPSASTSRAPTASKNARAPNDDSENDNNDDDDDNDDNNNSSSDSSVEDYLVNPAELDLKSSFFDVSDKTAAGEAVPQFDCNAGIAQLTDSGSEDNNETSGEETTGKAFDFRNLLEKATSLERVKETIAKRSAAAAAAAAASIKQQEQGGQSSKDAAGAMDVESLLALGENQNIDSEQPLAVDGGKTRQKLRQTKSTRHKRQTKARPAAAAGGGGESEDSDWEEVADENRIKSEDGDNDTSNNDTSKQSHDFSRTESLEIHVDFPNKQRNKDRKQQDLEAVLKRKLNRDIKERQLLLHKTSLLCCFARSYVYNRLLNDTALMQTALKLLPSKNSYPPERGTELKYFQSLVTWYKTAIKLKSEQLYPEKCASNKARVREQLSAQLGKKEARCKQDMIFIFVLLVRGMGLQCRLVVNMQPLPLRPNQADLCKITLKKEGDEDGKQKLAATAKAEAEAELVKTEHSGKESKTLKKTSIESAAIVEQAKAQKSKATKELLNKSKEKATNAKSSQVKSKVDAKELTEPKATTVKDKLNKSKESIKKSESVSTADKNLKKPKAKSSATLGRTSSTEKMEDRKEVHVDINKRHNATKSSQERATGKQKAEETMKHKTLEVSDFNESSATDKRQKFSGSRSRNSSQTHSRDSPFLVEESNLDTKDNLFQITKPKLEKLKRIPAIPEAAEPKKPKLNDVATTATPIARRTRHASNDKLPKLESKHSALKPVIGVGSPVLPKIVVQGAKDTNSELCSATTAGARETRSRSKSPKTYISTEFLQTKVFKEKFSADIKPDQTADLRARSKSPNGKIKISPKFLKRSEATEAGTSTKRVLRSRQKPNELKVPQLDGADDGDLVDELPLNERRKKMRLPQLHKLQKSRSKEDSSADDADFEPSPTKRPKTAAMLPKAVQQLRKDRRVLSTDDETDMKAGKRSALATAADMWVEVWSDVEEQWICIDLFKGKLHSVDAIRRSATSSFAYVYAFQNNLTIKDITARYCPHWTTTVRKSRVDKAWLDAAISAYIGRRTKRDIREDQELRRIHEEKPMPTTISDYKDHPLYALERHLLKFQAIYPPEPPTLGFIRGEPVYARDCVHTLHSREIWLKQARTVKLGEQPYKIVKARPKWDRLTQSVIKDQPLEIFGYWQTQDYEPPTAENGMVPRNAYGNVELFKACMLPKKTAHLKLPGLNRVCRKLGIDCANAVVGFDFHQGACHPTYDGFVVCEEFVDQVTAAWYQDQEEQDRKEQEKYEARVYGNWKKLIRGLQIRERLKKKYNF